MVTRLFNKAAIRLFNKSTITVRNYRERVQQCEALGEYAIAEDIPRNPA